MIDPKNVHHYDSKKYVKEEFLLFCFSVAGKTAITQAKKVHEFIENLKSIYGNNYLPFELITKSADDNLLLDELMKVKIGQYRRLEKAFREVATYDVDAITLEQLELIKGIGPKTARFFLLYTRKDSRYAVLDTHILKWMKKTFPDITIPKTTPPLKRYYELEKMFLNYCDLKNLRPEDIDLEIWKSKGTL